MESRLQRPRPEAEPSLSPASLRRLPSCLSTGWPEQQLWTRRWLILRPSVPGPGPRGHAPVSSERGHPTVCTHSSSHARLSLQMGREEPLGAPAPASLPRTLRAPPSPADRRFPAQTRLRKAWDSELHVTTSPGLSSQGSPWSQGRRKRGPLDPSPVCAVLFPHRALQPGLLNASPREQEPPNPSTEGGSLALRRSLLSAVGRGTAAALKR